MFNVDGTFRTPDELFKHLAQTHDGSIGDMIRKELNAQGADSACLQDMWKEYLASEGINTGCIDDMREAYVDADAPNLITNPNGAGNVVAPWVETTNNSTLSALEPNFTITSVATFSGMVLPLALVSSKSYFVSVQVVSNNGTLRWFCNANADGTGTGEAIIPAITATNGIFSDTITPNADRLSVKFILNEASRTAIITNITIQEI